ncbi:MAG: TIM-barrel domain-containing protein [Anaerolineales bacterium]|jgi:alpha-D-xyloside xylohydrolase
MDYFQQENNCLIWTGIREVVWIEPYGENIIRVRASKNLRIEQNDWTLLPKGHASSKIEIHSDQAILTNGEISATISSAGHLCFRNSRDEVFLEELWNEEVAIPAREYKHRLSDSYQISQYFSPDQTEHFFGMGQDPNNQFDLKGSVVDLFQKNSKCTIPFVVSTKKYGFLWNNPAIGQVEFANNRTRWFVQSSKQIDYLVIGGTSIADIVRRYSDITGKAPMLPEWAAGFWQSKLRYQTQEELLEVAREYKRRKLPISVIVIDYFHWTYQGDWKFDKRYWPDPKSMVEELEDMGVKLFVSVWPTVDMRSENYSTMLNNNFLVRTEQGVNVTLMCRGPETFYDPTHPKAGSFVLSKIKQNYIDYGITNFWLDESEPEVDPYDYQNLRYYLGNGLEMSSIYPYYFAKNFYDGLSSFGQTEIVNLIRSAWVGSQRFGVILWSGDIECTFESLQRQIKAGLNLSLCGMPWWTTDIGGFKYGGKQDDPNYRELMIRWFQFGTFCPIMRMHGFRYREDMPDVRMDPIAADCPSGGPNEVWSYGEQATQIMVKFMWIRERIKPYIIEQMKKASIDGTPLMRPLFFDFDDEILTTIDDEYMFGPDLLVAPVTKLNAKSRKVYLPGTCKWKDAWSGQTYMGGDWLQVETPLDQIPLFMRADTKLDI